MTIETLRWADSRLDILDQRELPNRVQYLSCTTAADVASAIRVLAVRGAPAIGVAAAYGIALAAIGARNESPLAMQAALEAADSALAASRPTAVNLFWALARMRALWSAIGAVPPLVARLTREAVEIHRDDVAVNRRLGAFGAALVPDNANVLTHCNTGTLATAGHGTALGVVRSAIAAGKRVHVFADETRPVLQGARLTAWELQRDGIPVTLLPDGAAGQLLASGRIDLVIVGADRVAANGDVANKIGTYMVAVLAARHGVPFHVACPLSTLDLAIDSGRDITIEKRPAAEVTGFGVERWAPEGIDVFNPAFDVTPAELVTSLITEAGVILKPDREKLLAMAGALARTQETLLSTREWDRG